jgi:hypothetical protein
VARFHEDLGRPDPSVPSWPGPWNAGSLWLAPEQIADRSAPAVVELMSGYTRRFVNAQPTDGDDARYKVIVIVFTDLSADRAQGVFDDVLQDLAVPSYQARLSLSRQRDWS